MRLAHLAPFLLLAASPSLAHAQDGWRKRIEGWTGEWKTRSGKVYLGQPVDADGSGSHYPFLERVRSALAGALANRGCRVQPSLGDCEAFITLRFKVSAAGLALDAQVKSLAEGELIESRSLQLRRGELPADWDRRTLRDVARELTTKLLEATVGQRLTLELGEFSGGEEEKDGLVSELSLTLKEYLLEELSKTPALTLITGRTRSTAVDMRKLEGRFSLSGQKVLFRLTLLSAKGEEIEAKVTAGLPRQHLPAGMALFPQNRQTAAAQVEAPAATPQTVAADVQVLAWVNQESGVYRDGDPLVVNIRPATDCHARVYYIQSDGTVFQIFPSAPGDPGKLQGGVTRQIGGPDSPVELTINDETLGQEFIKVFASKGRLDDSALPKQYLDGYGVFQMQGGYGALKKGIRVRGLTVKKKTLRPANEVKILIAPKR